MITGDNILTAMSIGKKLKLGITEKNKEGHYL
jgi:magnesium-transporting ATPase (P-type)